MSSAGATLTPAGVDASPAAIRHHYDVGDDFYALWLDETMAYSCALWDEGDDAHDLAVAQVRKFDHHAHWSAAVGAPRALDIGCGWGGLLRRLVDHHGVGEGVGLTLSQAQAAWIAARPDPRISIRLEHWRDHRPEAPYHAITSVGAFEHFVRTGFAAVDKIAAYREFFRHCHRWLVPGGRLSVQTIAYGNSLAADASPFITQDIFPESDLPRLDELLRGSEFLFAVERMRCDAEHYARTLALWEARLRARHDEAVALVGADLVARYRRYFQVCRIGFHTGALTLCRIGLRRIDRPRQA